MQYARGQTPSTNHWEPTGQSNGPKACQYNSNTNKRYTWEKVVLSPVDNKHHQCNTFARSWVSNPSHSSLSKGIILAWYAGTQPSKWYRTCSHQGRRVKEKSEFLSSIPRRVNNSSRVCSHLSLHASDQNVIIYNLPHCKHTQIKRFQQTMN